MTSLPENTQNRLQRIPQIPHVWEGDRLPIVGMMDNLDPDVAEKSDCIIWLDGSEGFVRSMDIIRANMGPEAVVRALLKAIESPHSPAEPARPQKVLVKDRELQFFLRGVLQNLNIQVEYQPQLPLLDELWQNFQNAPSREDNDIDEGLTKALEEVAISQIWKQQPWLILSEEEIIRIEINKWGVESLYACVMGMLGQEFGIILYRSIDTLKSFRQRVIEMGDLDDEEEGELESTFLQQDCWFVNFSDEEETIFPKKSKSTGNNTLVITGSIHPYEGIRTLRDEVEVLPVYVALKALGLFIKQWEEDLLEEVTEEIKTKYTIVLPSDKSKITVNVSTMPELTKELESHWDDDDDDDWDDDEDDDDVEIFDDLIPNDTRVILALSPWENLVPKEYESMPQVEWKKIETVVKKKDFPVIILQTTRSKGKTVIDQLEHEEGITYITFTQGKDYSQGISSDLGVMKTGIDSYYIFANIPQFPVGNDYFPKALKEWKKNVGSFKGYCAVVVAMGVTGASKGNPQPKDFLRVFYYKLVDTQELGFGDLMTE